MGLDNNKQRRFKVKGKFLSFCLMVFMLCLSVPAFATRMQDSARFVSNENTFSSTAAGTTYDVKDTPMVFCSLQEYTSDSASATYTVVLEGSLDGSTWTTLLTRTNASASAVTFLSSAEPVRYLRMRPTALLTNHTFKARFLCTQS